VEVEIQEGRVVLWVGEEEDLVEVAMGESVAQEAQEVQLAVGVGRVAGSAVKEAFREGWAGSVLVVQRVGESKEEAEW